jgi:hypothetical protein
MGTIEFVSLDSPDNARGKTADGVVIDEAGIVEERAWYEVLRPMISDTYGWALIQGTPAGRNWFWREQKAARGRADSIAWQVPTLGVRLVEGGIERQPHPLENPGFPFEEAVTMWQTMPQVTFQQEFLAEFTEDQGLVFQGVLPVSAGVRAEPIEGHRYVMGVDWGKLNDWTVLSVFDATEGEQAWIERFNMIDYQTQVNRLKSLQGRYSADLILAESNAMGEPLIDQLWYAGLPIQGFATTQQSKTEVIESLKLAIERRRLVLLNHDVQIHELQSYGMSRLPSGRFTYSAPPGLHDDTVIALALAWKAAGMQVVPVMMPSIYDPVGEYVPSHSAREARASVHANTAMHMKWAKKHFCRACFEEYQGGNGR